MPGRATTSSSVEQSRAPLGGSWPWVQGLEGGLGCAGQGCVPSIGPVSATSLMVGGRGLWGRWAGPFCCKDHLASQVPSDRRKHQLREDDRGRVAAAQLQACGPSLASCPCVSLSQLCGPLAPAQCHSPSA